MPKRFLIFLLITGVILAGCEKNAGQDNGEETPVASGSVFAMDTYMTITCYGDKCEEALLSSIEEINRIDALLSTGSEASEISKINAAGGGEISADTAAIIGEALDIYGETNGAFDITVYPLMKLWGFADQDYRVPGEEEIAAAKELVGSNRIDLDAENGTLAMGDAQEIDLGGIAKGYTSDRLMEIFEEYGLVSGLVSLGGNVQCLGLKTDDSMWRCGIRDPLDPTNDEALAGIVLLDGEAAVTSGGYERYFTEGGKTYHHIIDPETGYPAESGLLSVTIVSESGILADALSTALFVMGLKEAEAFWRENGDDFGFVIMADGGEVYVTEDLADRFSSEYPTKVVEG